MASVRTLPSKHKISSASQCKGAQGSPKNVGAKSQSKGQPIKPSGLIVFFLVLIDTIGEPRVPALVHVNNFETDVVMREDGGDMGMFASALFK